MTFFGFAPVCTFLRRFAPVLHFFCATFGGCKNPKKQQPSIKVLLYVFIAGFGQTAALAFFDQGVQVVPVHARNRNLRKIQGWIYYIIFIRISCLSSFAIAARKLTRSTLCRTSRWFHASYQALACICCDKCNSMPSEVWNPSTYPPMAFHRKDSDHFLRGQFQSSGASWVGQWHGPGRDPRASCRKGVCRTWPVNR